MASILPTVAAAASSTVANRTTVAPFSGLKSTAAFPVSRKANNGLPSNLNNTCRVQCMKVWPPEGLKKFETLSYLPPLSDESLGKEVDYLLRSGWVPCLEFSLEGYITREYNNSPGYYDGRYWTMWKLPMFGCTESSQVLKEVQEAKNEYPDAFIRIIGFDNKRQVQCISFIAYQPDGK